MPTSDLSFYSPYFLPQVVYFTSEYISLRSKKLISRDSSRMEFPNPDLGFRIPVLAFGFRFPFSLFRIPAFSAAPILALTRYSLAGDVGRVL